MKKKKKKIETVRLITFDQAVIDVVGGTVLRREILENFIVANNEMMTVVGGKLSAKIGEESGSRKLCVKDKQRKFALEVLYEMKP